MHVDPAPSTPPFGQPATGGVYGQFEPLAAPFPPRASLPPESRIKEKKRLPRALQAVFEIFLMLLGAAVVALLLRAFVVQVYKIPSESMLDTMEVGSRIAVSRVPVLGKEVERGDIIVFRDVQGWLEPVDQEDQSIWSTLAGVFGFAPSGTEQIVVKRVIGVGGDVVACCDESGRVTVNGVGIDEPYLAQNVAPSDSEFSVVVPEGMYWVMGDNRSNSADSRFHNNVDGTGFIPASAVIGRAQWEIWPIHKWSYLGNRDVFEGVPNADST